MEEGNCWYVSRALSSPKTAGPSAKWDTYLGDRLNGRFGTGRPRPMLRLRRCAVPRADQNEPFVPSNRVATAGLRLWLRGRFRQTIACNDVGAGDLYLGLESGRTTRCYSRRCAHRRLVVLKVARPAHVPLGRRRRTLFVRPIVCPSIAWRGVKKRSALAERCPGRETTAAGLTNFGARTLRPVLTLLADDNLLERREISLVGACVK